MVGGGEAGTECHERRSVKSKPGRIHSRHDQVPLFLIWETLQNGAAALTVVRVEEKTGTLPFC